MSSAPDMTAGTRCPDCDKVRYSSRKRARLAMRQMTHRRPGSMNAYRCGEFWHIGHLPSEVRRGVIARDALIPPSRSS